jgi:membrane fusion protein (multidrug efflux system)
MTPNSRTGLLVALVLLYSPLLAQDMAAEEPGSTYRVPVTGVRAQSGAIRLLTRVQGVIEAIDAPEIRSKVAAEVVEVNVDEGDPVQAGQVLARLDDEGFRLDKVAVQADIQRLQALLENRQSTLERDQSLTRQKLVSDAKLDDSRAAVKQTRAQLAHARSLLDKALYQLSHTQVVAPIGGVVQQRSVSRGDYVNPNSPNSKALFQIVDTGHLRARLYFPENLARRVAIGIPVELIKGQDRVATRIAHIRPMLEAGNRALHALADFDNGPQWKPGESISATAVLAQHAQAVVVPQATLVRRPAGLVVYRLEDGASREVSVTTGIRERERVEILSGAAVGDLLALDGAAYLSDGTAVEIKGDIP